MLADAINTDGLRNGLLFFAAVVVGSALVSFLLVRLVRAVVLGKEVKRSTGDTPVLLKERDNDHG